MESVNKGRVRWALTETSDENLRNTLEEVIENFPDDIQLWELPQWFGTCLTARLQNNQEDLKEYFDDLMELHKKHVPNNIPPHSCGDDCGCGH